MGSVAAASERSSGSSARGNASIATPVPFSVWFPAFLRDEIRPYPGRVRLVLRYVLAATLTMLIITTFRIPGAAVGGFYSLSLPRQSPTGKARAAFTLLSAVLLSLASVLLGGMVFANYPLTHFLWVVSSFFVGFFLLSVLVDKTAATAFVILISLAVPAWDLTVPTAALVIANLWTAASIVIAVIATAAVEFTFFAFQTKDPLEAGLEDRLAALRTFLQHWARGAMEQAAQRKVQQFAVVGVSRLRLLALSGHFSAAEKARRGTVVSLVGRLLDLAALAEDLQCSDSDKVRLKKLAEQIGRVTLAVPESQLSPSSLVFRPATQQFSIVDELQETVELLNGSLSHNLGPLLPLGRATTSPAPVFAPDAWTNPDHLNFALRGCLAATVCYVFMNAVDWHGLGSSLFTVVVTATTSIGSSRQRQLLRFSGAMVGGLFFGIGSQILIIPLLDSIAGFTVLFVAVTAFAAWFLTASPRISYFGAQVGLAFYLIQLRIPAPETSLEPARDNLMGIVFGLAAMWFVFDALGSKSAIAVMQEVFARNLKLLAQLARHGSGEEKGEIDLQRLNETAEKIRNNFATVADQGDAVLFELGPDRHRNIALRERLRTWDPPLRSFFLFELLLLHYRSELSSRETPPAVSRAYQDFSVAVSDAFQQISTNAIGSSARTLLSSVRDAYTELCEATPGLQEGKATTHSQAAVWAAGHIVQILDSLTRR